MILSKSQIYPFFSWVFPFFSFVSRFIFPVFYPQNQKNGSLTTIAGRMTLRSLTPSPIQGLLPHHPSRDFRNSNLPFARAPRVSHIRPFPNSLLKIIQIFTALIFHYISVTHKTQGFCFFLEKQNNT